MDAQSSETFNPPEIEIKNGEYTVINHGAFVLFDKNKAIELSIIEKTSNDVISLKIEFVDSKEKSRFEVVEADEMNKKLMFRCIGYNNPLGAGIAEPISIANVNNRRIFFRFMAFSMNQLPYIIYTFYANNKDINDE